MGSDSTCRDVVHAFLTVMKVTTISFSLKPRDCCKLHCSLRSLLWGTLSQLDPSDQGAFSQHFKHCQISRLKFWDRFMRLRNSLWDDARDNKLIKFSTTTQWLERHQTDILWNLFTDLFWLRAWSLFWQFPQIPMIKNHWWGVNSFR